MFFREFMMTIAHRLQLLVGAALLSLLVLTGINYQQMNQVYEQTNYSSVNVVPSIEILNTIAIEFGRLRIRVSSRSGDRRRRDGPD